MQELLPLVEILESFLGESKNGVSDNGQIQFNCPACADDNGLDNGDGKYNLEVNLLRNKYRCWACEHTNNMSGKISSLLKKYGGDSILYNFKNELSNIKKTKEYEFNFLENNSMFEDDDFIIELPAETYDFKFNNNKKESNALNYLLNRGINAKIIKKYNLKYTDNFNPNRNFRNRIIIPSYDKYGSLNYYTSRDYTGKSFRKYYNYEKSSRKDIIFNENLINLDSDIILVEGPTDHLVIPNSIPLLGKSINSDFYLFNVIVKKSTQNIIVFLDDDATTDAIEICKKLSCVELCGRIKIVPTKELLNIINKEKGLDLKKLDPSELYYRYGYKGISWALKQAVEYICV